MYIYYLFIMYTTRSLCILPVHNVYYLFIMYTTCSLCILPVHNVYYLLSHGSHSDLTIPTHPKPFHVNNTMDSHDVIHRWQITAS